MLKTVSSVGSVGVWCSARRCCRGSWVRISLEAKYLQHLSAQLIHYIYIYIGINATRIYKHIITQCTNMAVDGVVIKCSRICNKHKHFGSVVEKVMNANVGKPAK